ncbi:MAG TPA: HisA/HisF-related TIM barrel protein, partial [Gemmatimonadaceae bacterium]
MIAIPAVDLRNGACVQLVGGSYQQERVRLDNPIEVARSWEQYGFTRLHVVDLDAATGRGSNLALVRSLIAEVAIPVQVGGGVRSGDLMEELLDGGATQVVVGTRAVEEMEWLAGLAARHPGEIIVACDVRGRRVTTRGWTHTLPLDVLDAVEELNAIPLGALLVTAVHR